LFIRDPRQLWDLCFFTGATNPYAFYEEKLREVQELIPREFAMMNASYEYGDFPARPLQRECLSC